MAEDQIKSVLQMVNHASIVAWENIADTVLSQKSRRYDLVKGGDYIRINQNSKEFKRFCDNHSYLAKKTPIIGWVTSDLADIKKTQELLYDVGELIHTKRNLDWAVAEILSKVLAYRNMPLKSEIEIPMYQGRTKYFVRYRVDKVFNLWKDMRAFGLTPLDSGFAPILLFRGTDFSLLSNSSRISVISNFDPGGPGFAIYKHARRSIKNWLDKACRGSEQAIVMGFSLGGALASYALMHDPEYFNQHTSSYLFNHPGLTPAAFEKWNEIDKHDAPLLHAFVSDGDVVSKFGYLFDRTYGVKHTTPIPPIKAHTMLLFLQPNTKMKLVDIKKENDSLSRKTYSKLHTHTTKVFYNVALKLLFPID